MRCSRWTRRRTPGSTPPTCRELGHHSAVPRRACPADRRRRRPRRADRAPPGAAGPAQPLPVGPGAGPVHHRLHDPVAGDVRLHLPVHRAVGDDGAHRAGRRTRWSSWCATSSPGCRACPADVREAARGMGYGPARLFWQIDLPLALPAFMAGLRIATVSDRRARHRRCGRRARRSRAADLSAGSTPTSTGPRSSRARSAACCWPSSPTCCWPALERLVTPWARAVAVMNAFGEAMVYLNDPFNWTRTNGILELLGEHLAISAVAVLAAFVIAFPIGDRPRSVRPRRRGGRGGVQRQPRRPDPRAADPVRGECDRLRQPRHHDRAGGLRHPADPGQHLRRRSAGWTPTCARRRGRWG